MTTVAAAAVAGVLAEGEASVPEVLAWSAGMIALLVVGMAFAARLKRRFRDDTDAPAAAAGFTLADLRQMHRAGQLTDVEFERAKEKIVEAARKAAERAKPPEGAPVDRDSPDAIRARRLAREAQGEPDAGEGTSGDEPQDPRR